MSDSGAGLAGLVLAAGSASRFGSPKQLARLRGLPLVTRCIRVLRPVCSQGVWVVTGAAHQQILDVIAGEQVTAVYNPAWREGVGASIRQGVAALPARVSAVLIILADQAAIETADLQRLVDAWRSVPQFMAAAQVDGRAGAPAIFPRSAWPALARLHGDAGAAGLLRQAAGTITGVDMPSAAIDVDTPTDLAGL